MSKKVIQAPEKVRAVIYARYSSERQTEQSIEGQLRECRAYADDNNLRVVGTYIDRAKTGTNDNRADFQKMLRDSAARTFDYVIVWKIDRFGRNREDIAINKAILRRNGVTLLSAKERIPEGPEGIILESLLEGLAEYYSAELNGKVIRGMRESAYKCRYNGSAVPLGYSVDAEKRFVIDPVTAPVVHRIFDLYESGKLPADIMRDLNAAGFRTSRGNSFTVQSVQRIISNRFYIGEYSWADVTVPGGVPRIIEDRQFEKVQDMIEKNKKTPVAPKRKGIKFLLTGRVFCGRCGSPMFGDSGTGKSGERHYYYSCKKRKRDHACDKKSVLKEWLEKTVVEYITAFISDDRAVDRLAQRCVNVQLEEKENSTEAALRDNLKRTETAISNIMKAIEAGVFTETTATRLRELEAEAESIKIDLTAESVKSPGINKEQIVFFITSFRGGDPNDPAYRSRLIDTFVNRVIVYDDRILISLNFTGENNEITAPIPDTLTGSDIDFSGGQNKTTPCGVVLFWRISSSRGDSKPREENGPVDRFPR